MSSLCFLVHVAARGYRMQSRVNVALYRDTVACAESMQSMFAAFARSRFQLLVCAEARVSNASLHQLVHVLLVDGSALTLTVWAVGATHIWACMCCCVCMCVYEPVLV
jgi:hypothetical protein